MKALRIGKGISLLLLTSTWSAAFAKPDINAAAKAARVCNADVGNIVLATTNAVDERPYRLAVLRGKENAESLACLDRWSIRHLQMHAQIVSILPPKMLSKAEIEQKAEDAAGNLTLASKKDGRIK